MNRNQKLTQEELTDICVTMFNCTTCPVREQCQEGYEVRKGGDNPVASFNVWLHGSKATS